MTVHPGWGGQSFIARGAAEAARPCATRSSGAASTVRIGVDGGVNLETIRPAHAAGGAVLVAGSALYSTDGDLAPTVAACSLAEHTPAHAKGPDPAAPPLRPARHRGILAIAPGGLRRGRPAAPLRADRRADARAAARGGRHRPKHRQRRADRRRHVAGGRRPRRPPPRTGPRPSPRCAARPSRPTPRSTTTARHRPRRGPLVIELRPNVVAGTVTDPAGEPIAGVRVFVDGIRFAGRDRRGRGVSAHRRARRGHADLQDARLPARRDPARATRTPSTSRWSRSRRAPSTRRRPCSRLRVASTRCSPCSTGPRRTRWSSTSRRPTAASTRPPTSRLRPSSAPIRETPVFDLEELLPMLKERGIYTIARMVVMKDNTSAARAPGAGGPQQRDR